MTAGKWEFWIDRGGTFTDIIAKNLDNHYSHSKVLSENPKQYQDAVIYGIRQYLGLDDRSPIPCELIEKIKMGTTVATNALLERHGEPTALITTEGFRDVLQIGYQNRPDLFSLEIKTPTILYQTVAEVPERILATGDIEMPLDTTYAKEKLQQIYASGIRSVAIVLIHSYKNPTHEAMLGRLAEEIGFTQISMSATISPNINYISRGDTCVVDAYLTPILKKYVDQLKNELPDVTIEFMQSNGGLTCADYFQGKNSILSGPAGGVVGMVETAKQAGFDRIIGFDMGGTSTDVSHFSKAYEHHYEHHIAGVRLQAPMMNIHTVAAGGGSIIAFKQGRCQVGPESAGADPGPACYRQDGPLTITDCNVLLGKIKPAFFPHVFGEDKSLPINTKIVAEKFQKLKKHMGSTESIEHIAQGFIKIAVDNMANAIKKISVEKGYDITHYVLNCFGAAAGQHACLVADALAINQIYIHPYASVLSAYGIGIADHKTIEKHTINKNIKEFDHEKTHEMATQYKQKLITQGFLPKSIQQTGYAQIRYEDTDTTLEIPLGERVDMEQAFAHQHRQLFGFIDPDKDLMIDAVSIESTVKQNRSPLPTQHKTDHALQIEHEARVYMDSQFYNTPIYCWEKLPVGKNIMGPAIILDKNNTLVIEPQWQGQLTPDGSLLLERTTPLLQEKISTQSNPIYLEIFNNYFMNIAEQMGTILRKTAGSINIKERLDFSCAIFDGNGELVANAPHIPAHLGSMSESVKSILQKDLQPGDAVMMNSPYCGGTHLPDITIITPVFIDKQLLFYTASRGHHVDIGGITPGSMPPQSQSILDEGIDIEFFYLIKNGTFQRQALETLLTEHPYPARSPKQNLADFKAQIGANEKGTQLLRQMVADYGMDVVKAYMGHICDNAERAVKQLLPTLKSGTCIQKMDNGCQVQVSVSYKDQQCHVDFSGTSEQQDNNFNAPLAVTKAAVLYVIRCLVKEAIPLNSGCLKAIQIHMPENCMLNPVYPAAVVAGNVETSQVIVDSLFGALDIMACSQGTMNNFTFGNEHYQYYETICGGSGAGFNFQGTSAIHTHMTNTRLTDPEILELRYPVKLDYFSVRQGSGGQGQYTGGDGVVRKIHFLEPMTVNILSNHRIVPPFGLHGGQPGQVGKNYIVDKEGKQTSVSGCFTAEVKKGEAIIIETPGGGGYGNA